MFLPPRLRDLRRRGPAGGRRACPVTARRTRETLSTALDRTVRALDPADLDAAAVRLAQLYARQIDQAGAVAAVADRALRKAREDDDEQLVELVQALRAKLGEREALDRLGARLAALLVELQATPKSRPVTPPAPEGSNVLAQLRLAGS